MRVVMGEWEREAKIDAAHARCEARENMRVFMCVCVCVCVCVLFYELATASKRRI